MKTRYQTVMASPEQPLSSTEETAAKFSQGLQTLFLPIVEGLDQSMQEVQRSQENLANQIDCLSEG